MAFLLFRRRQKAIKLLKIYQQFKHGGHDPQIPRDTFPSSSILPPVVNQIYINIENLPFPKALLLPASRLSVNHSSIIGKGAYGVVYEGVLDKRITVAVKTVRGDSENSKLNALLSEVKIMSFVGRHPNIVQLLGVELSRGGKLNVALEYCSRGSLEEYLHQRRDLVAQAPPCFGPIYNIPGYLPVANVVKPLSAYQLLICCHQVCSAMEFLASKKIIHGDLAARNVLLDSNFVAKISDFGLSRKIYNNLKKYVVADKDTLLPFQWLAPETLRYQKFSTESDIWAFGIFMWEVFSMCEIPYGQGTTWNLQFVENLEGGDRLGMPAYATPEIYDTMRQCWSMEPFNRITFQHMSIELLRLHESVYKKENE